MFKEIDEYLNQAKERGYSAVLQLGSKGVNYATNVIMQTAIKVCMYFYTTTSSNCQRSASKCLLGYAIHNIITLMDYLSISETITCKFKVWSNNNNVQRRLLGCKVLKNCRCVKVWHFGIKFLHKIDG